MPISERNNWNSNHQADCLTSKWSFPISPEHLLRFDANAALCCFTVYNVTTISVENVTSQRCRCQCEDLWVHNHQKIRNTLGVNTERLSQLPENSFSKDLGFWTGSHRLFAGVGPTWQKPIGQKNAERAKWPPAILTLLFLLGSDNHHRQQWRCVASWRWRSQRSRSSRIAEHP